MDDLTPEERRVVEWLRERADAAHQTSLHHERRNRPKPAARWLSHSLALFDASDAIEHLEHRKAPQ